VTQGYLLDTHALLWLLYSPKRLSALTLDRIADSEFPVFASAVSAYEVAYKFRLGKLDFAHALARNFAAEIQVPRLIQLLLSPEHASVAGGLAIPHKDPFDRMLIAQAQIEQLTLISNEKLFDQFGVIRLW
jgi:PIN domain nuclease of toxin-antitoxin system